MLVWYPRAAGRGATAKLLQKASRRCRRWVDEVAFEGQAMSGSGLALVNGPHGAESRPLRPPGTCGAAPRRDSQSKVGQSIARRGAMRIAVGGIALASAGGAASAQTERARGPRPFLSDNEMWEAFGGRAVGRIVYGGAEIGECRAAVEATGARRAGRMARRLERDGRPARRRRGRERGQGSRV